MNLKEKVISKANEFVKYHDDSWTFICLYIGLAVSLSMLISIFWLVAVAFLHGCMEWASLRMKGKQDGIFKAVTWHLRVDIVLIFFALWLGVYIDAIFGVLGLGAFARSGAHISSRAIAWQRAIRGVLLTSDDAVQLAKALAMKNGRADAQKENHEKDVEESCREKIKISKYDIFLISLGACLAASILLAPLLTSMTPIDVISRLYDDLHPWP